MVAVAEIINENTVGQFMLDAGDQVTRNGITAEWKGSSFQVTSMNAAARERYPNVRVNQPLPRSIRGGFVNALRAQAGLPRIDFDGSGQVRGAINNTPVNASPSNNNNSNPEPNSREGRIRTRRTALGWVKSVGGKMLGLPFPLALPAASYFELRQTLASFANQRYADDPEVRISEERYQQLVSNAVGAWMLTVVGPVIATGLTKLPYLRRAWAPIKRMLNSAMFVRQAASAATGPGFLGMAVINILIFIATELAAFLAIRYIANSERAQVAIQRFLFSSIASSIAEKLDIGVNAIMEVVAQGVDAIDDERTAAEIRVEIESTVNDAKGLIDPTATNSPLNIDGTNTRGSGDDGGVQSIDTSEPTNRDARDIFN
jgi:hypothetical protein